MYFLTYLCVIDMVNIAFNCKHDRFQAQFVTTGYSVTVIHVPMQRQ